jgi:hypothetical protein
MKKFAIYTVLTGGKEALGEILSECRSLQTDLQIDFICFTDDKQLRSDTWDCRVFPTNSLPPEKSSRRPKTLPHAYLAEYDYSLYLDNICRLKRLPNSDDLRRARSEPYVYRLFKHSSRNSIIDEAIAIASLGYDDARPLICQLEAYAKTINLEKITPLSTCTVLLREHNSPKIISHGIAWWEHILNYSKRDQMSFDFCRLSLGVIPLYFEGSKFENDLIYPHANVSKQRRLASYDHDLYLWLLKRYGINAEAKNPHVDKIKEVAIRTSSELELVSYLTHSPLGNFHLPRLNIAEKLQPVLNVKRNHVRRIVGIYCDSASIRDIYTLDIDEFRACLKTLQIYFSCDTLLLTETTLSSFGPLRVAMSETDLFVTNMSFHSTMKTEKGNMLLNQGKYQTIFDSPSLSIFEMSI